MENLNHSSDGLKMATLYRMIIRNVLQSDQGSYECYAENTVGFARNTVTLRVHGNSSKFCRIGLNIKEN